MRSAMRRRRPARRPWRPTMANTPTSPPRTPPWNGGARTTDAARPGCAGRFTATGKRIRPSAARTCFSCSVSPSAQADRLHTGGGSVMTYSTDHRVDAYIDALPDWQQAICRRVRDLVHAADPDVSETIKRTRQPYFVLDGNICALLAATDHVNVFLYDGGIVPDPHGIITGGHGNKTARTVAVRRDEDINAPALTAMFRQIIANNRAGGWRKLKRDH